jgi:hypothetical protein
MIRMASSVKILTMSEKLIGSHFKKQLPIWVFVSISLENKEQNICAIHAIIRKATLGWQASVGTPTSHTTHADCARTVTINHTTTRK